MIEDQEQQTAATFRDALRNRSGRAQGTVAGGSGEFSTALKTLTGI